MAFIPEVPGFLSHRAANAYIRENGTQFSNLQLAVVRFCDLVAALVQTTTKTELSFKPRKRRD